MINKILNLIGLGKKRYKSHSEGVIIACYYNPQNSRPRLDAFNKFYETIKHMNHRILECVVQGSAPQLPSNKNITRIFTNSNLWHKEQLLNRIIRELPQKFKYVFWVDADVLFTNKNWMVDAVEQLNYKNVVQLFEYCSHLEQGESAPSFDIEAAKRRVGEKYEGRRLWRSYAANYSDRSSNFSSKVYDICGHVGFAWGAKRSVLDACPLFEKAVIGGADGIIAYASTGLLRQSQSIVDMFGPIIEEVYEWGDRWDRLVRQKTGYVKGDLYHIWHGDIKERQYYSRIKGFSAHLKKISDRDERDENGLLVTRDPKAREYFNDYYKRREPIRATSKGYSHIEEDEGDDEEETALGVVLGAVEEILDSVSETDDSPREDQSNHHGHVHGHHHHHDKVCCDEVHPTTQPTDSTPDATSFHGHHTTDTSQDSVVSVDNFS